jgi:glyoxylase-like metal-dependent hydrolase (beta-lactamase superfamily II)
MSHAHFSLRQISASLSFAFVAASAGSAHAVDLQSASDYLGANTAKTITFSGTGKWYQFGQAPAPTLSWPQFDVSSYQASINYETASARVQIVRKQTVEKGRNRPTPVEQRPDQNVNGDYAWNLALPPNSSSNPAAGATLVATPQPATLEERRAEIWATPQGFLKAALSNYATLTAVKGGIEVNFKVDGVYKYVGFINNKNQVEYVKTWIYNPVLGNTEVETKFTDYKDVVGAQFPTHIVRKQGGYPVLDIKVADVKVNAPVEVNAPQNVVDFRAPAITVTSTPLAEGVFYLTGGTHHSVAIDQGDHIVIVEAPLNEDRSLAVINKAKEIIPGKPIKYLINTHAHFDHSGGLRTYVHECATIVTELANKPYYQKIWAQSHSLNPDRLSASQKPAKFETVKGKLVLDGKRKIELHSLAGNSHNDAFILVYLPAEKILVEADAYTPLAAGAAIPSPANPFAVNLYDNIKKLKLDVETIAALHGPKAVTLADLKNFIGQD